MGDMKTAFSDAVCPTPDPHSGYSGTPGGFDVGPGENGLHQTPWDNPVVPTPSGAMTPGELPTPITQVSVDGSTHEGESLQKDIRMPPLHTVDEK